MPKRQPKPEESLRLPFWLPYLRWVYTPTILSTFLTVVVLYLIVVGAAADGIYHFDSDTPVVQAIGKIFPFPAGYAGGQLIPLSRVRAQTAALMVYDATNKQSISRALTETIVTQQIADRILYRQALAAHGSTITDAEAAQQTQSIAKSLGGTAQLESFLAKQYGPTMTLSRFQDWIVADSLAEAAVEQQLLVQVTVSHILISVPANATAAQVEAARQQALQIKASITSPDQFAAVAKQQSDDVASRDKGGALGTTERGNNSAYGSDFENAVFSLKVGQVSDPVRSPYGWHLILVTKRTGSIDLSLAQYTSQLRASGHERIFLK